jgi:alkanesulfonate monooxygenase
MTVEFSWHVPCGGDGRWMSRQRPERAPRVDYLAQIARAAEQVGFDRVLVPTAFTNGNHGLDAEYAEAYTVGLACLAATERIRVTVAHRPGFVNPGLFAQMCATADDWGGGRLALNIVTGTDGDMRQFGDQIDHDARYRRAEEYLTVLERLWTAESTTFLGEFYRLEHARLAARPAHPPELVLVGASPPAIELTARHADVYMMSLDTVETVRDRIAVVAARAAESERRPRMSPCATAPLLRFCVAATVFAAETDDQARAWARDFAEQADRSVVAQRAAAGRTTTSTEDLRARADTDLHTWLTPQLWRGIAHLTHGTALVGSHQTLAELIRRYVDAGVTMFQFYGYPYLEQAYNVGENLLPEVRERLR